MQKTLLVLVLFPFLAVCDAAEPRPDQAQIIKWLKALPPLPKVHYSWALPEKLLDNPNDRRLFEYARITHAVSINDWATPRQVESAAIICKEVNQQKPKITATIAINYSPWHRVFPKDALPTDFGPKHQAAIARFRQKLTDINQWLADANVRHNTNVRITAILLDTERFHIRKNDKPWNQAITEKYDVFFDIARDLFPHARIIWYARGVYRAPSTTGWKTSTLFTYREKGDIFSCSLYRVPEIGYMRETFRRTLELAKQHGCDEVVPWVALASGYRRKVDKFHEWYTDWDYDLIYSWMIGAELNHPWYGKNPDRFAPYHAAKVIAFYPPPFDPRTPAWVKHFVAYVRGAHQIKELPLLGKPE